MASNIFMRLDNRLGKLLRYLGKISNIKRLYYPGSGFHRTPLEALGQDKVYHVSLPGKQEYLSFFERLNAKHMIISDYRKSPFRDNYFDATLIWGIPLGTAIEAIDEFIRVTKPEGLLIVDGTNLNIEGFSKIHRILDKKFPRVKIPLRMGGILNKIFVYIVIK